MCRYILKKDLPTFKAGDRFYLGADRGLYLEPKDGQFKNAIKAYDHQTLYQFPNILTDWFEEIQEYKRWRAELDKSYWFVDSNGYACENSDNKYSIDNYRYNIGNYFNTREEVINHIDYLIALQTIKDDAKGFVPDWKDIKQPKYYGYYNYDSGFFCWDFDSYLQTQGVIYFKTKEDIKESFKKHHEEWLTVLGVEE